MTDSSTGLHRLEDVYPATPLQEGLLFHGQRMPLARWYVEQSVHDLAGPLNAALFERAWQAVVARHTALRTAFAWEGGRLLQVVLRQCGIAVRQLDWRGHTHAEQTRLLETFLDHDRQQGFDVTSPPLMRLTLMRLADEHCWFVWTNHHVILDGWSCSLVLQEVAACYRDLTLGRSPALPPSRPYREYVAWLGRQDRDRSTAYWRAALADADLPTPLPGHARAGSGQVQHEVIISLSRGATEQLQHWAGRLRVTMNTVALGLWGLLVGRYSRRRDVVFGAAISGRPVELPDIERTVGLFISTLPARVRLSPAQPLGEWLRELHQEQLAAREFAHLPLVDIQRLCNLAPHASLFDSLFVFENYPSSAIDDAGDTAVGSAATRLRVRQVRTIEKVHYPLTVLVTLDGTLQVKLLADLEGFDKAAIERIAERYVRLLEDTAAHTERRVSEATLMTQRDARALADWNRTAVSHASFGTTVIDLFEAQARHTPDSIALVHGGIHVSYGELDRRSNQLARYLRRMGVGRDGTAAICLHRTPALPLAVLAMLKAGAAYVPLDASYPPHRLAFMARDSRAAVLVSESGLLEVVRTGAPVVPLDTLWPEIARECTAPITGNRDPLGLAYVIYTSGSTGHPKGIGLSHGALHNLICWQRQSLPDRERVLQFSPLSFDVSFQEIFSTWSTGGTLVLIADAARQDPTALTALIRVEQVGRIFLPFVALQQLAASDYDGASRMPTLREVITAGEQLKITPDIERFCEARSLRNHYGPSETHVVSEFQLHGDPHGWPELPPIGAPIANTHLHVVDEEWREVPAGVPGELWIGGDSLARGYVHQPALTAARFVPDPFSGEPGARLYRTGDLACWREDGTLDFLGRADQQLKLRGYRIEPAEIEAQLAQIDGIRESAVVVREDTPRQRELVAYVVSTSAADGNDIARWRTALKAQLPDYMVPSRIVPLERLPLTPSGKVDRKALPAPGRVATETAPARPHGWTEEVIAAIWSEVLGRDDIGPLDDFFELGGHSLLATKVISRLSTALGQTVPLQTLFDAPTIHGLARHVSDARAGLSAPRPPLRPATQSSTECPASFAQQRLWFLAQMAPDGAVYNIPCALRLRGPADLDALTHSMRAIVQRHAILRTSFSERHGVPIQVVDPAARLEPCLVDLSGIPADVREAAVRRLVARVAARPFSLTRAPLLTVVHFRLDATDLVLLATLHHIISDGWSIAVMVRELCLLYEAHHRQAPNPLPDLPIQYADFSIWQRSWLDGDVLDRQVAYWRQQLADIPRLALPRQSSKSSPAQSRAGLQHFTWKKELTRAIETLGRKEGVTTFMVLLAGFAVVLGQTARQTDVAIGTDVANRHYHETEGLIGFFVNQLVLRLRLDRASSFRALLAQVRQVALDAYAHQDVPFERVVEALAPTRDASTPLFQVKLVVQNLPPATTTLPGIEVTPLAVDLPIAKFDLTLTVEQGDTLAGGYTYDLAAIGHEEVAELAARLTELLTIVVGQPDVPLDALRARLDATMAREQARRIASLNRNLTDTLSRQRRSTITTNS